MMMMMMMMMMIMVKFLLPLDNQLLMSEMQ